MAALSSAPRRPFCARGLAVLVTLFAVIVLDPFGGGALAQSTGERCPNPSGNYPPGQCKRLLGVSANVIAQGRSVQLTGEGFAANSATTVVMNSQTVQLRNVTSDGSGRVVTSIVVPANVEPGPHEILMSGVDSSGQALVLAADVTVTGSRSDAGLAQSGSSHTVPLTAAALAILVLGVAVVAFARRDRPTM